MQLIQLRSCLLPEMRRTLEVGVGVHPGSAPLVQRLHKHVKWQRNGAFRRLSFFQCRQAEGEKFNEFCGRLKQAEYEVDLSKTSRRN